MSNNHSKSPVVGQLRREAKQLIKQFRHAPLDSDQAIAAATRLVGLRSFSGMSAAELLQVRSKVQLKHALAVVAEDQGYGSWLNATRANAVSTRDDATSISMHEATMYALMNRWFADYGEAVASLQEHGGYLLPYRSQYYITERAGISLLGLNPDDPDWDAIGYNWIQPMDRAAWSRIRDQRASWLAVRAGAVKP